MITPLTTQLGIPTFGTNLTNFILAIFTPKQGKFLSAAQSTEDASAISASY
jgi:hypothetical protein